jgi:hypothetical protein
MKIWELTNREFGNSAAAPNRHPVASSCAAGQAIELMCSYLVEPYRPGMSEEGNGLWGWIVEYFFGSDFPFFTDIRSTSTIPVRCYGLLKNFFHHTFLT